MQISPPQATDLWKFDAGRNSSIVLEHLAPGRMLSSALRQALLIFAGYSFFFRQRVEPPRQWLLNEVCFRPHHTRVRFDPSSQSTSASKQGKKLFKTRMAPLQAPNPPDPILGSRSSSASMAYRCVYRTTASIVSPPCF